MPDHPANAPAPNVNPIHVRTAGDGPPALLLHSHGMSGRQFRALEAALVPRGFRVIIPDFIGHGRSEPWPDTQFHFRHELGSIRSLVLDAGAPVHLVGHSYGGFLALCLAVAHPEAVASLSLYDPVAFGVLDRAVDPEWDGDLARIRFGWGTTAEERDAWLRGFVDYWSGEGTWASLRPEAREGFTRAGRVIHDGAEALTGDRTPVSAYAGLHLPTLLLTGASTPPAERRVVARLAAAIPGARQVTLAGAGHMGPLTHGEAVAQEIVAHLEASRRPRV